MRRCGDQSLKGSLAFSSIQKGGSPQRSVSYYFHRSWATPPFWWDGWDFVTLANWSHSGESKP